MPDPIDQASFWDKRFETPDYVFGTSPNAFLCREAYRITPGSRVLAVADGEGRNSVFLAQSGHDVVATDISERGIAKARRLADEHAVKIDFRVVDLTQWDWPVGEFDAVVAIFIQFAPPKKRDALFSKMIAALKPGGVLMLHGYRPEQLKYGTGGPPSSDNMYTEALLRNAFSQLEIELLESYDAELEEGRGHSGMSALIDLVARGRT